MPAGDTLVSSAINANSGSSSAPAAGSVVSIAALAEGTIALQLTGTWSGTLVMEGIEAGGDPTAWVAAPTTTLAGVPATNLTANGIYIVNAAPFVIVRVRATAWSSGTATVTLHGALASMGGGGGGGGGGAVTVADGADAAEGTTTDAAVQGDNTGTISAKLRGLNKSVAAGLPITAAALPLPAGAATDATVGTLTAQSDFDTKTGSLTEAAPGTDTASSGLNGRLQRIAQRLSSLIALLPAALVGDRLDVNLGAAPGLVTVQGDAAAGSPATGNPVLTGGTDGTNARALLLNTDGSLPAGGFTASVSVTPTITAGAYTSGFDMGGLISIVNAVRLAAGSGVIQSITVTDKAKANNAIDFLFFIAGNPSSTTFTDHGALTVNAADLVNCKMVSFPASAYSTLATNSVGTISGIGLPFKLTTGQTLYCAAVARGTNAYASTSDLSFRVAFLWD